MMLLMTLSLVLKQSPPFKWLKTTTFEHKSNWLNDWLSSHSSQTHSQQTQTNQQFPHTLSCSSKFKVGAVSRVASSGASSHVEDVDSGGSEACYHHTGGFGPRWWVTQLLLLLEKKHQIVVDKQMHFETGQKNMFLRKPTLNVWTKHLMFYPIHYQRWWDALH